MELLYLAAIAALVCSVHCAPKQRVKLTTEDVETVENFVKTDSFKSCLWNYMKSDDAISAKQRNQMYFKQCTRDAFNSFNGGEMQRTGTASGFLESIINTLFSNCFSEKSRTTMNNKGKTIIVLADPENGGIGSDELAEMGVCMENSILGLMG